MALDQPDNLIRVILYGISARSGAPGVVMPGFAALSDADIVRLAAYVRRTSSTRPAWTNLPKTVAAIRAEGRGELSL